MPVIDTKIAIQNALKSFASGELSENAISLFNTLGYNTTAKQSPLDDKSFNGFKDSFLDSNTSFSKEKALVKDWQYIDLLFQITEDEMSAQNSLFASKKVDNKNIRSYLFFAIELSGQEYSRTALAQITREVNRVFAMPVLLIFKYADKLTLSIIDRRENKKNEQKDVLLKVTLIKDISITSPHRAHVEILFDLSFDELNAKYGFTNFVELQHAWQETLDTKELNKRFYRELSNWYFWAVKKVSFPNDIETDKDDTVFNSESVIRLLTRLIFIWFIREKGLIPEAVFDSRQIVSLIKNFMNAGSNVYYRAILQNLFFATLNQKVEDRDFKVHHPAHYGVKTLYRYTSEFKISKDEVIKLFRGVPFLNGGLFDCLDTENKDDKSKVLYIDGFSDNPQKQANVPDELFFSEEQTIDLSEVYDDRRRSHERIKGLFKIFDGYKFTITENTPIEEEVALDPELLGRVFENLLASYNPETKTTARKQTGSFYTPREIVNYMVDESLIAYLKTKLLSELPGYEELDNSQFKLFSSSEVSDQPKLEKKLDQSPWKDKEEELETELRNLLSYSESETRFNQKDKNRIIEAIDNCKILDPACGSGAFPMGILHKLVHILHKLDPQNEKWKERQIRKAMAIDDSAIRDTLIEDIEIAFSNNELDYGRKLYLIENCIYGVDIQPIATQISKLRFFISLIVDQKPDRTKDNFGIRSLPNLETKFVAANTLIGLDKPEQGLLPNMQIQKLENELKDLRHNYFCAKNRKEKLNYQKKDQSIRDRISEFLIKEGWETETAHQLASWNPYNQNTSSPFFDPEWMFGIRDGFDIVIGNPPYLQLQKLKGNPIQKAYKDQNYEVYDSNGDLYCLFYEKGIQVLGNNGSLCLITSNKWMRAGYGEKIRLYFLKYNPLALIDLGPGVFESATVDTNILLIGKSQNKNILKALTLSSDADITDEFKEKAVSLPKLTKDAWFIGSDAEQKLKEKIEEIGKPLKDWDVKIYRGVLSGLNEAFIIDTPTKEKLCAEDPKSAEILKPILRGRDIKRYSYDWAGLWLIQSGFDINVPKRYHAVYKHLLQFKDKAVKRDDQGENWWNLRACAYYDEFEKEKVVWTDIATEPSFSLLQSGVYFNNTVYMIINQSNKFLTGVLNSNIIKWYFPLIATDLGEKGQRFFKIFVDILPIPPITSKNRLVVEKIESLVDKILDAKKSNPSADTSKLESEIDQLVYELYDLTPEEIAIIKGSDK